MKRILFALAAIAVLAVGGFVMAPSAHPDDNQGSCSGPRC